MPSANNNCQILKIVEGIFGVEGIPKKIILNSGRPELPSSTVYSLQYCLRSESARGYDAAFRLRLTSVLLRLSLGANQKYDVLF